MMKRIVHLDLKGAPLKLPYLEKVLLLAKSWGANGILLEWEDTFHFTGDLVEIGSQRNAGGDGMYSMEEVQQIFQFAQENGLEAIQLVQTIGHMEYVLKHPAFRHLRELPQSPAVLCPSKPESVALVKAMLEQTLAMQPEANYLHIGADEVWHTAVCTDCQQRAAINEHKAPSLYLQHIQELALFLKQKRPNLTILMWDDMLRTISVDTLKAYQLGDLVQPVVWHYNPEETFQIDPALWHNYKQVFPSIWAGSAFKGANGSCQILSPVNRYVSNHQAWMREFKKYSDVVNFTGIILTGWSRYDHYAALCELLPVSLPSLASCLNISKTDDVPKESLVCEVLPSEQWCGEELARCIHSFVILRERASGFLKSDVVMTWLNPWQIQRQYTNPLHIVGIASTAQQLLLELSTIQNNMAIHLNAITGERTKEEWLQSNISPIINELTELYKIAENRAQCEPSVNPR